MRYIADTNLNPYFVEHRSDLGAVPSSSATFGPACACARGIGDDDGGGGIKLLATLGFLGLVVYGINRFSKGK